MYLEYPIIYTNAILGHYNHKLVAQTLPRPIFYNYAATQSYGYVINGSGYPLLNPSSYHIPLAPWFPTDSSSKWGLNPATVANLRAYARPGLDISYATATPSTGVVKIVSDIALAGARPVYENNRATTITILPGEFSPNGSSSTPRYSAIRIIIYISREPIWNTTSTKPKLVIEKYYVSDGSGMIPDKTELVSITEIPDVPYFFFNFAVSAPGAPSAEKLNSYSHIENNGDVYYLCPGGGSGAGAQFTAMLSTNTVHLSSPHEGSLEHTDKITMQYTLASPFRSSSYVGFDPAYAHSQGGTGIDLVRILAELHYTNKAGDKYYYQRSCGLPGGLVFPGITPYYEPATQYINFFINNKDSSDLVASTFPMNVEAIGASALIFHRANWMLPEEEETLFNKLWVNYLLRQPFTVFNPEGLFPGSPETKLQLLYTGAAGRPSILNDGTVNNNTPSIISYGPAAGIKGAGAGGALWMKGYSPNSFAASGGPTTIVLSW